MGASRADRGRSVHLAGRRTAPARRPLRHVRHDHVPSSEWVPALRCSAARRAPARDGGVACGRGRRRSSRRRRRPSQEPAVETSCRSASGYVELPGELRVEARLTEHRPEHLRIGMEMELVVVPFGTDEDGNEVVTFAFRPVGEAGPSRGGHRHGRRHRRRRPASVRPLPRRVRHRDGRRSRSAARSPTRASSGATCRFAFGGSYEVDNPDAVVSAPRADGHPVHRRVQRLRHRGERARPGRRTRSASASTTSASRSAWTSTCRERSPPTRVDYACPSWYGELGHFVTTKFFGMKINKYMHDHGISPRDAREGRRQELPQRCAQPERVPAQAAERGGDPRFTDAELSADAVHVLQPRRRRGGRACCAGPSTRDATRRHAHLPARDDGSHAPARRLRGPQPVAPARVDGRSDGARVAGPRTRWPASRPRTSTSIQLQDTDAGAEVIHLAENGFCADGEQEALVAERRDSRSTARCP